MIVKYLSTDISKKRPQVTSVIYYIAPYMITKTNDKLICHEQPFFTNRRPIIIWDKVFKNGPSEICSRQPLKNLK